MSKATEFAIKAGITIDMDGNMYCATDWTFKNLAVSPAGFGETEEEALLELCHELRFREWDTIRECVRLLDQQGEGPRAKLMASRKGS